MKESLQNFYKSVYNNPMNTKEEFINFYGNLNQNLSALITGYDKNLSNWIANLANASALLWQYLPDINWAGFYLVEGDRLMVGPFQGKPACREIAKGRGVCGTAWETNEILVVPNVHQFPGHIACDEASRSEIVLPIHQNGSVIGVLDIDSPLPDRFNEWDRAGLMAFVGIIEETLRTETPE